MTDLMYITIESRAGGVFASDVAFIRAAWSMFGTHSKTRDRRANRRKFYDSLLDRRDYARGLLTRNTRWA